MPSTILKHNRMNSKIKRRNNRSEAWPRRVTRGQRWGAAGGADLSVARTHRHPLSVPGEGTRVTSGALFTAIVLDQLISHNLCGTQQKTTVSWMNEHTDGYVDECTALLGAYHGSSTGAAHHGCSWCGSRGQRRGCTKGKGFLSWHDSDTGHYPPKTAFTTVVKIQPEMVSEIFP